MLRVRTLVPVFPASLNVVSGSSCLGISTASPKSNTFNMFLESNPIFAGFKSLNSIRRLCRYAIADAISIAVFSRTVKSLFFAA